MNYVGSYKPRQWIVALAIGACFAFFSTVVPAKSKTVKTFEFALKSGSLENMSKRIQVTLGDRVELIWHSDEKVEIHLHGYDQLLVVPDEGSATMTIDCTATGRFPITLHGSLAGSHGHRPLVYFEVHPK